MCIWRCCHVTVCVTPSPGGKTNVWHVVISVVAPIRSPRPARSANSYPHTYIQLASRAHHSHVEHALALTQFVQQSYAQQDNNSMEFLYCARSWCEHQSFPWTLRRDEQTRRSQSISKYLSIYTVGMWICWRYNLLAQPLFGDNHAPLLFSTVEFTFGWS